MFFVSCVDTKMLSKITKEKDFREVLKVGDNCSLKVPVVDKGPLDEPFIHVVIIRAIYDKGLYEVGTSS